MTPCFWKRQIFHFQQVERMRIFHPLFATLFVTRRNFGRSRWVCWTYVRKSRKLRPYLGTCIEPKLPRKVEHPEGHLTLISLETLFLWMQNWYLHSLVSKKSEARRSHRETWFDWISVGCATGFIPVRKKAATILRQMMDFDKLLEKHQQDSEIRLDLTVLVNHFVDLLLNFLYEGNAIAKIMGALSTQKFCLWRRTQNV